MPPPHKPPLSIIECAELATIMDRKYAAYLKNRYFEVSATYADDIAMTTVVLTNATGSFYYPVECRMNCQGTDALAHSNILFLVDFCDSYFEEYLRDGDVYVPIDWCDFEFEGREFQIRGQVLNLEAERLADKLLGEEGDDVAPPPPPKTLH